MKYECPFDWKEDSAFTCPACRILDVKCELDVHGLLRAHDGVAINVDVPTGHGNRHQRLGQKGCGGLDLPQTAEQAGWLRLKKEDGSVIYVPYWI